MPKVGGLLVISIDWHLNQQPTKGLHNLLADRDLGATWITSDPQNAPLQDLTARDEVGITLGDPWAGPGSSPILFERELQRRLEAAAGAGYPVVTIATERPLQHADIVAAKGGQVLRQTSRPGPANTHHATVTSDGLCVAPQPIVAPVRGWWQQRGLDFTFQRSLRRICQTGEMLHVQVDVEQSETLAGRKSLARLLDQAVEMQRRGKLHMGPLRQILSRFRRSAGRPQRSVLRAA